MKIRPRRRSTQSQPAVPPPNPRSRDTQGTPRVVIGVILALLAFVSLIGWNLGSSHFPW